MRKLESREIKRLFKVTEHVRRERLQLHLTLLTPWLLSLKSKQSMNGSRKMLIAA
jgi:hypothetical protein